MKRKLSAGLTSVTLPIWVQSTASTTGGGLSGLTSATSGLVCEYRRQGQSTWTAIALSAGTLGTWASGTIVADGSLAGAYELDLPDAVTTAGARWVAVRLYGAANMLPVLIEIELDAVNYQDATAFGLSRLDATVSSRSTYAGGAVASVTGNVGGNVVGSVGSVTGSVGSVTGAVTVGTNNDKSGYSLTQAFPTNFASLAIDAQGRVTTGSGSAPSANDIRDAIFSYTVDGSTTFAQSVRGANSALMGKASGLGVSNTPTFRDLADTKNRITATTDANGNRSVVVRDLD